MLLIKHGHSGIKLGRNIKSTENQRDEFVEKPQKLYGKSVKYFSSMNYEKEYLILFLKILRTFNKKARYLPRFYFI